MKNTINNSLSIAKISASISTTAGTQEKPGRTMVKNNNAGKTENTEKMNRVVKGKPSLTVDLEALKKYLCEYDRKIKSKS